MRAKRAAVTRWAVGLTVGFLALLMGFAGNTQLLMPGPTSTVHGTLDKCDDCHSEVPAGPFGWAGMVFASVDAKSNSQKCLHCHMDKGEGLLPHGIAAGKLSERTAYWRAAAPATTPVSHRLQNGLFPIAGEFHDGVPCATCHTEHKGERADLTRVANADCQACHVVRFSSFADGHPPFSDYPFQRRTRINFDHASHFSRYFADAAKDDALAASVPKSCDTCHISNTGKRIMSVRSFTATCKGCHEKQITGEQRAIGPKGIPFVSIPGLDLQTLAERGAAIGEWPEYAEAKVTPFMQVLIGRDAAARQLLESIQPLDLLDLRDANDAQIKAVEDLAWRVKELILDIATSRVSNLRVRLAEATGDQPDSVLVSRLIATMPRDILVGMWRDWLPNLADEIARHRRGERVAIPGFEAAAKAAPPAAKDVGTKEQSEILTEGEKEDILSDDKKEDILSEDKKEDILSEGEKSDILSEDKKEDILSEDRKDDILSEDKKDDILSEDKKDDILADGDNGTPAASPREDVEEKAVAAEVDEEEWVDYGGWYRRNFQILYRPTGHADRFFRAWLDYSARLFNTPGQALVEPVFNSLVDKDAQGQCAKCHSIDREPDGKLLVKWGPADVVRSGKFTLFSHEPHFEMPGDGGCVTCHGIDPKADYQSGYKDFDPKTFASNFTPPKQDLCAECHVTESAGDECQLCHTYHVERFSPPLMATPIAGAQH